MRTLAAYVIDHPDAARVFERYGLDYCCHGDRSLADACASAGLDAGEVEAALAALDRSPSPVAVSDTLAGLIGHIVTTHHTYLRRELPRLAEMMAKVVAAHAERHPELIDVQATLAAVTDDLLPHLLKEERVLFPLTIELLGAVAPTSFHCGSVANPIRMMQTEHDRVGDLLATLRHQTHGYTVPDDGCPTWRALCAGLAALERDTHTHVHLENNVLFPKIVELEVALA